MENQTIIETMDLTKTVAQTLSVLEERGESGSVSAVLTAMAFSVLCACSPPADNAVGPPEPAATEVAIAGDTPLIANAEARALIEVSVRDSAGRPAIFAQGEVRSSLAEAGAGAEPGVTVTSQVEDGRILAEVTSVVAGPAELVAVADGVEIWRGSVSFVAGPVATIAIMVPSQAAAGVPLQPAVRVTATDAFANPTGAGVVTLQTKYSGPESIGGTLAASLVAGQALLDDVRLLTAGEIRLVAEFDGRSTSSSPITVSAGPASQLSFGVPPAGVLAGAPIEPAPAVWVSDAFGNLAPNAVDRSVTIALGDNAGGASLIGSTTRTTEGGVATFEGLVVTAPGDGYTLTAQGGFDTEVFTSPPFNVVAFVDVSGVVSYERPLVDSFGLHLDQNTPFPIRGAHVQALDSNGQLLDESVSADDGTYTLRVQGTNHAVLRIIASSPEPPVSIVDNTASAAVWALDSEPFHVGHSPDQSLRARLGATGGIYDTDTAREAAPFAILDTAVRGGEALLAVAPQADLPHLLINWSPKNHPSNDYDKPNGAIGGAHYTQGQIFLTGDAFTNTDEFDEHVILHEWGHYLERALGREDGLGGSHSFGQQIDPRIAFSEGFATALAAMVLAPDTRFINTFGEQGDTAMVIDIAVNKATFDPKPGWYSEVTVATLLFDLFDSVDDGTEAFDNVALGMEGIWATLSGPYVQSPALATIFTFIHGMKTVRPDAAAAIDALSAAHNIATVDDGWGSSETADAGWEANLPVFRQGEVDGPPVAVQTERHAKNNDLTANRYVRFLGTGQAVSLGIEGCDAPVFFRVFQSGEQLTAGWYQIAVATQAGLQYVAVMTDASEGQGINSCDLALWSGQAPEGQVRIGYDNGVVTVDFPCDVQAVELRVGAAGAWLEGGSRVTQRPRLPAGESLHVAAAVEQTTPGARVTVIITWWEGGVRQFSTRAFRLAAPSPTPWERGVRGEALHVMRRASAESGQTIRP